MQCEAAVFCYFFTRDPPEKPRSQPVYKCRRVGLFLFYYTQLSTELNSLLPATATLADDARTVVIVNETRPSLSEYFFVFLFGLIAFEKIMVQISTKKKNPKNIT